MTFTDAAGVEPSGWRPTSWSAATARSGRPAPPSRRRCGARWEKVYPYSWLGILADVAPSTDELIYAWHPDGFALHSMRSATVSRLYLQVPNDTDHRRLVRRPDLGRAGHPARPRPGRLDARPRARSPTKSVLPMRSFVQTPMRHGRLFLAGDAAHIVPPTGAKGLNLAVADVALLAPALVGAAAQGRRPLSPTAYSDTALRRVWRCTHFSWWMTTMLHTSGDPFDAAAPALPAAVGHLERGRRDRAGRELRRTADRILR